MTILYNLAITLLYTGIAIASLFNSKARKLIKGHHRLFKRIKESVSVTSDSPIIWFHAASTGEFEQGRPVMEEIKKLYPEYKILLTFFSPSGYEAKKKYAGADYIFYMPFDFSWNARRFYQIVRPIAIFFIKYEFWYNFIHMAHRSKIPVYCFSAIFRPNQFFFKWYGLGYQKLLYEFDYIFVQNTRSKELLNQIGIQHVEVCGDTRFDRVAQIAAACKKLPVIESFAINARVVIAGSTWPADERLLVKYFIEKHSMLPDIKLIIVPHEVDNKKHMDELVREFAGSAIRYSQINAEDKVDAYRVLIIDVIGILSSAYRYGYLAYIGGGFGKGIHNILEAATYGIPIIFGPRYKKFHEAVELTQRKGAFGINNYEQLTQTFDILLTQSQLYQQACQICKNYVLENLGSTHKIIQKIVPVLQKNA